MRRFGSIPHIGIAGLLFTVNLVRGSWPVEQDSDGNFEPLYPWEITKLEEGKYFEGDIVLQANETPPLDFDEFNARRGAQYRWPGARIPFALESGYNEFEREVIRMAQQSYARYTCIRWIPRTIEKDYIYIFSDSGCYSSVGDQHEGLQYLSLERPDSSGTCIIQGIAQHEMMHASGFYHEQSRTDRDDYVTVMWNNILQGKANNFLKYGTNQVSMLGVRYDYGSIMHYGNLSFSVNPKGKAYTLLPKTPGVTIGQRKGFSATDVLKLNKYYNCPVPLNVPAPIDNGTNPRACSFDVNWCGWTQDYKVSLGETVSSLAQYDDDFDWMRLSIPTPSRNTGPAQDHTTGKGKYLYIEASSPRTMGDLARIRSPWIPANNGKLCISFWYNMYSSVGGGSPNDPMGSLRVYVLEKMIGAQRRLVWLKSGTHSTSPYEWLNVSFSYTPSTPQTEIRVLFEGVVGSNYQGDAAFDDFFVADGSCPTMTPTLGSALDCTYEAGTCGYTGDPNNLFNWNYQVLTMGPITAQFGSRFMGVTASYPSVFMDSSKLVSSPITLPKTSVCLSFYYNLQSTSDGSLRIYIRIGTTDSLVWKYSSNTSPNQPWAHSKLSSAVPPGSTFQVVFEATRGLGPETDFMAIDNVLVSNC